MATSKKKTIPLPPSPESKRIREAGKCYDCGGKREASDGHYHSKFIEGNGKAFAADCCCKCAHHKEKRKVG